MTVIGLDCKIIPVVSNFDERQISRQNTGACTDQVRGKEKNEYLIFATAPASHDL